MARLQSGRHGLLADEVVTSVGGAGHRRGPAVSCLVYRGHGKALSSLVGFASAPAAATATACFAADQTSDIGLRAEVRALGALLPLYYGDPRDAVEMTRQSQAIGTNADSFASALARTYEALGHAQLAAVEDSEAALSIARDRVGSLGSGFQEESVFEFSKRRWHFYEGKVLSYLGRSDEAWTAHEEALSLYPDDVVGDPALILFDRAISLVRDRQVSTGCQLAERSLFELPQEHSTDLFIRAARRVLTAVPGDQKTGAAVQRYWKALHSLSCRVPKTK